MKPLSYYGQTVIFAVYQASRASSEQGRMSINLSLNDKADSLRNIDNNSRGWWDYVPEASKSEQPRRSMGLSRSNSDPSGIIHYVGSKLHELWSNPPAEGLSIHRKSSLPGEHPIPPLPRTSIAFSTHIPMHHRRSATKIPDVPRRIQGPPPPSPSAMSRLSKYMPRMQLFKRALKNEV